MKADLTAWALWGAAILIPVAAHAMGLSFVLRDIDSGQYFLMSPLWLTVWQPLVLIGLLARNTIILIVSITPNAIIGRGLLFGNFVQLPLAPIAPSGVIADTPRLEILVMHVAAMLTGAAGAGVAVYMPLEEKAGFVD